MSRNTKFRFCMGCGEPLQCRRWVTCMVRAQSALQKAARPGRARSKMPAPREGKLK